MEEEEEDREKENQDLLKGNMENIYNQCKPAQPVNLVKCPVMCPPSGQEPGSLDLSLPRPSSSSPPASPPSSGLPLLGYHQPPTSNLNLLHSDGVSVSDQMAALLGPEQVNSFNCGQSWAVASADKVQGRTHS